jgi:hypothetical protein
MIHLCKMSGLRACVFSRTQVLKRTKRGNEHRIISIDFAEQLFLDEVPYDGDGNVQLLRLQCGSLRVIA